MRERTLIIAEAGVNHNGNLELAKQMVDVAKQCEVDIVKFQTSNPEALVSRIAAKAEYQVRNTGSGESQLDMIRKLVLPFTDFEELAAYCKKCRIQFLSTPFDIESIEFLDTFDMPFWKIPSGAVTDYPYLVKIARTQKPVVMSTGMCELEEIAAALQVLRENGAGKISLLHCNTEYPTPYTDVNLAAMQTLQDRFQVEVGYSDHTRGIEVPIAAVAMGAGIIEKHFTLDRTMVGPDHKASLEPEELRAMVSSIRNIESAIGSAVKEPSMSERKNMAVARKSIVAAKTICAGERFTEQNITTKRPGNGISPMRWQEILGMSARRDFAVDELIEIQGNAEDMV